MALVLKKKPQVQVAAPAPAPAQTETESMFHALILAVGEHMDDANKAIAKIKVLQESVKPYETALKKLQEQITKTLHEAGVSPEEAGSEIAGEFVAEYSKAGNKRSIENMAYARELLGDELFMTLAKVNLSDLDAYLTPPQLEKVIVTEPSGRKVTVTRRK